MTALLNLAVIQDTTTISFPCQKEACYTRSFISIDCRLIIYQRFCISVVLMLFITKVPFFSLFRKIIILIWTLVSSLTRSKISQLKNESSQPSCPSSEEKQLTPLSVCGRHSDSANKPCPCCVSGLFGACSGDFYHPNDLLCNNKTFIY